MDDDRNDAWHLPAALRQNGAFDHFREQEEAKRVKWEDRIEDKLDKWEAKWDQRWDKIREDQSETRVAMYRTQEDIKIIRERLDQTAAVANTAHNKAATATSNKEVKVTKWQVAAAIVTGILAAIPGILAFFT